MQHGRGLSRLLEVLIRGEWEMSAIDLPRSDSVDAGLKRKSCLLLTGVEDGKGGGGGSAMLSWVSVSPHGGAVAAILGGSGIARPKLS